MIKENLPIFWLLNANMVLVYWFLIPEFTCGLLLLHSVIGPPFKKFVLF